MANTREVAQPEVRARRSWCGALAVSALTASPWVAASARRRSAGDWTFLWVDFIGSPLGAILAAIAFHRFLPERRTLTAKLVHDERYVSTLRTRLPAQPPRGVPLQR